jgi:hypothetical protein
MYKQRISSILVSTTIVISILLLLSFNLKNEKTNKVEQIIGVFLKASGGINNWKNIRTFSYEKYVSYQNDSSIALTTDKVIYQNKPLCLFREGSEGEKEIMLENKCFRKRIESNDWIDMSSELKLLGVNYRFDYGKHFRALEFSKKKNNFEGFLISNKKFSKEYYVIEQDSDSDVNGSAYLNNKINYFLFSKNTGLLDSIYTTLDDKLHRFIAFQDYEEKNNLIFPTKTIIGLVSQKAKNDLKMVIEHTQNRMDSEGIEVNKGNMNRTLNVNTMIYKNVIFNQPIDESVFEMN